MDNMKLNILQKLALNSLSLYKVRPTMGNKGCRQHDLEVAPNLLKIIAHNGKYESKGIFKIKIRHVSHDRSISMTDF